MPLARRWQTEVWGCQRAGEERKGLSLLLCAVDLCNETTSVMEVVVRSFLRLSGLQKNNHSQTPTRIGRDGLIPGNVMHRLQHTTNYDDIVAERSCRLPCRETGTAVPTDRLAIWGMRSLLLLVVVSCCNAGMCRQHSC